MQAIIGELELSIKFVPFLSSSAGSFKKENEQVTDRCCPSTPLHASQHPHPAGAAAGSHKDELGRRAGGRRTCAVAVQSSGMPCGAVHVRLGPASRVCRTKPTVAEKKTEAANRDQQPDSPTNPESRGIVTVTLTQAKSLEARHPRQLHQGRRAQCAGQLKR